MSAKGLEAPFPEPRPTRGVQRVTADVLRMPRLSDSMSEATIVGWLKQPGSRSSVASRSSRSRPTRRRSSTRPRRTGSSPRSSFPRAAPRRSASPSPGSAGRAATADPSARPWRALPGARAAPAARGPAPAAPVASSCRPRAVDRWERARATPVARRTASQLGVSLSGLTGTGHGGRIRQLDVLRAGSASAGARTVSDLKGPTTRVPLSTTGRTIARRMTQSRAEIPTFEVVVRADMSTIVELRRDAADLVEAVPSVNDFVVRAAAIALREHPAFNSSFVDGQPERHGRVNVGIAVATDDALLVPTVVDADLKRSRRHRGRDARPRRASSRPGGSRPRSSPPPRSRSRISACSASFVHGRDQPASGRDPRGRAVGRSPVETAAGGVAFRDVATSR